MPLPFRAPGARAQSRIREEGSDRPAMPRRPGPGTEPGPPASVGCSSRGWVPRIPKEQTPAGAYTYLPVPAEWLGGWHRLALLLPFPSSWAPPPAPQRWAPPPLLPDCSPSGFAAAQGCVARPRSAATRLGAEVGSRRGAEGRREGVSELSLASALWGAREPGELGEKRSHSRRFMSPRVSRFSGHPSFRMPRVHPVGPQFPESSSLLLGIALVLKNLSHLYFSMGGQVEFSFYPNIPDAHNRSQIILG